MHDNTGIKCLHCDGHHENEGQIQHCGEIRDKIKVADAALYQAKVDHVAQMQIIQDECCHPHVSRPDGGVGICTSCEATVPLDAA